MTGSLSSDPVGLHRVLEPPGVLPQAAWRLDTRRALWPDEVRVRVERLNLDAASFRQLREAHGGDGDKVRAAVLDIVDRRGKMQNPETGSGGMLLGTVEEVGPESPLGRPPLDLRPGDRVATLVSLTLTPLVLEDGLERWDGRSEQVPADGYAILFGRSVAARLPDDLPPALALAVLDVCGAPALTARVVSSYRGGDPVSQGMPGNRHSPHGAPRGERQFDDIPWETDRIPRETDPAPPAVAVLGGAGKSGSLALAAAREAGAGMTVGVVPTEQEAEVLRGSALADHVVVADARDPVALRDAVHAVAPGGADVTVVCVDVPGCEGGAILTTRDGGTVVFFSMATSFPAAALGAEGLAADVTMLVGNGYVPGHSEHALSLVRRHPGVRALFERRLEE